MDAKLLFLHALSPLHAGTGQGVGAIDLPIAREKGTEIPIVPGSSVKGVLRDLAEAKKGAELCTRIFGPDTNNADAHAGAVQITDLRLVALPVRSLAGVFAWVSSPLLLKRLSRDARMSGANNVPPEPRVDSTEACLVSQDSALTLNGEVIVEDVKLTVAATQADAWAAWIASQVFDEAWKSEFIKRFCIVHDDVMSFLLQIGTEVTARIRLEDDKKTVAQGALWYEEALPAETLLAGLVAATPIKANGQDVTPEAVFATVTELTQSILQIGGNATVGRGLCRLIVATGGTA